MASRTSSPSAAAFEATERNAATSAVAPSKTSGAQKWNGTADSLNATPTVSIRPPKTSTIVRSAPVPLWSNSASRVVMVGRWAVPSTPASRLSP